MILWSDALNPFWKNVGYQQISDDDSVDSDGDDGSLYVVVMVAMIMKSVIVMVTGQTISVTVMVMSVAMMVVVMAILVMRM
jgi:hypothetical protein